MKDAPAFMHLLEALH